MNRCGGEEAKHDGTAGDLCCVRERDSLSGESLANANLLGDCIDEPSLRQKGSETRQTQTTKPRKQSMKDNQKTKRNNSNKPTITRGANPKHEAYQEHCRVA